MILGFTGTRNGMTEKQHLAATIFLQWHNPAEFHHGDCTGADEQAARIAQSIKIPTYAHPPTNPRFQAHTENFHTYPAQNYHLRNRHIVHHSDTLLAIPRSHTETGGTWYTIGYALEQGIPVAIIWPDGTLEHRPK